MKTEESARTADVLPARPTPAVDGAWRRPVFTFAIIAAGLCAVFMGPLFNFVQFAVSRDRNSYLLIVPVVTAYLIWIKRREIRREFRSSILAAIAPLAIGIGCIYLANSGSATWSADPLNRLSVQIFALLNLLLAGAFISVGAGILRQILFPAAFLIFATPVPHPVGDAIEIFLQHGSAEVAYHMITLTSTPVLRDGLVFQMPGLAVRVAQECSGYNSSFVLFMLSTLAGYLFLMSPWKRFALTAAVIPLALVRNAFRITTLAVLTIYHDPGWIESPLHHRGGPIFFALSLIPFFLFLWWLRKSETKVARRNSHNQ